MNNGIIGNIKDVYGEFSFHWFFSFKSGVNKIDSYAKGFIINSFEDQDS